MHTHVHFTRLNKLEAMYRRSHVNVKVEPGSAITFTRNLPHVATILSTRVKKDRTHVKITQQWKSTIRVDFQCRVIFTCVRT